MSQIFVRFTIKGDNLNINEITNDITIDAMIFVKGESVINKFSKNNKVQKTNRWVYSIESQAGDDVNSVLTRMKKDFRLVKHKIIKYTQSYSSLLDIVIYSNADKPLTKFNVSISKTNLKFIGELNTKMSLTVFDW